MKKVIIKPGDKIRIGKRDILVKGELLAREVARGTVKSVSPFPDDRGRIGEIVFQTGEIFSITASTVIEKIECESCKKVDKSSLLIGDIVEIMYAQPTKLSGVGICGLITGMQSRHEIHEVGSITILGDTEIPLEFVDRIVKLCHVCRCPVQTLDLFPGRELVLA